MVEGRPLMVTETLADHFLRVVVPQGFQPHKPLPARRPHRYVFSCLDLIPLLFQIGDKVFKQEGTGNAGIHVRSYLAVPCRLALLLRLPGVPAHGAALFRVFYHGQAMLLADAVAGTAYLMVAPLVGVVVPVVLETDRVENQVVE